MRSPETRLAAGRGPERRPGGRRPPKPRAADKSGLGRQEPGNELVTKCQYNLITQQGWSSTKKEGLEPKAQNFGPKGPGKWMTV